MTFGARSGSHDDILLSLAIACWRLKVAGDEPGILSYYRNAGERAKQTDLSVGATEVSRPSRWVGSPKQVAEDAQELYEVYWNTFSGLIQSNVCASCGKSLGLDQINDGVSLWHPDCPVPVVH
jgi:hypothetical protein